MGVLGTWVSTAKSFSGAALVSLAQNLCALIQVCEVQRIPSDVGDLLNDPDIVKVGIGKMGDAKLLKSNYNLKVESRLDLRNLAD